MSFFKKPTVKEQMRQNERDLKREQRGLQRDQRQLDQQEIRLQNEIKKEAKKGNKDVVNVLAKQLVQLRKQKVRSRQMESKVSSINMQGKMMQSNMRMGEAMKSTVGVMGQMNKAMKPEETAKIMQQFQQESMKFDMSEDMMNDALEDMFENDGDEEEEDRIVNQVLDEIGIDISNKMANAPSVSKNSQLEEAPEDDIEKQLARLKSM